MQTRDYRTSVPSGQVPAHKLHLQLFLVLSLNTGCGFTSAPQGVPPVAAQNVQVPFEICGESTTWTRPSEDEQNIKWWTFGRYANMDKELRQSFWTRNFFVVYGHASPEFDVTNLSGLWTLPEGVQQKCFEPQCHDAVLKLEKAEVWVLLHAVKSVKRQDTIYVVVVEPTSRGAQFVQFPRPGQVPLTLQFTTQDGRELDKIEEAKSSYWPYPSLLPTPTRRP